MSENMVIAVFCYKRPEKLRVSMEALLKNPECSDLEIIFFCDGPKGERDREGVMATREYIRSLTGFKKIHHQFREKNLSTGPNFQQGITYLYSNYERFIVVEDDLVVTPNYLRYLIDALEFYKDRQDVFCVTGFCFPIDKGNYEYDTLVHTRFCSYGWGSWSNRVSSVIFDSKGLSTLMEETPGFAAKLNAEGLDLQRMLKRQIDGRISTWDIQMQVHVATNSKKVIYPVISKTHNIGFDEESTNTFGVDYLKTITDPGVQRSFRFCDADLVVPALQKQLRQPYSFLTLVKRKLVNTYIKLTNQVKKAQPNP